MTTHGWYKWLVVAVLWCVCFLNYADRQLIFTVFPLLQKEFHLSDARLSLLSASFMCTYAIFGPVAGLICDRVSRRALVYSALLFWSLVAVATANAHQFPLLVAGVALGGLGEAFYFPSALSMIADYHAADSRSRAMSIHQSSVYVGSIAGGALAGLIGQFYGWRAGFRAFGVAGVAFAFALLLLLREPARGLSDGAQPQSNTRWSEDLRQFLSNRAALTLATVFVGANFVAMVFTVWMPTYLFRRFNMSLSMAGLNGSAYLQIASVAGVIAGGTLADMLVKQRGNDKSSRMRVQSLGLFCGAPFLFLSGWTGAAALLLSALIGYGFFKGVYDSNIWAALYDVTPIANRGSALGIMNSLGWLGGAVAQLCIGVASERLGMGLCLSATGVLYILIGLVLWRGALRTAKESQHHSSLRTQ